MSSTEQSVAGGNTNLAQAVIESQNCLGLLAQACPASAEIRFMLEGRQEKEGLNRTKGPEPFRNSIAAQGSPKTSRNLPET